MTAMECLRAARGAAAPQSETRQIDKTSLPGTFPLSGPAQVDGW
jgi:hypothetical protein